MAFNPNIPQATDQLSQSQSDLLENFQSLGTLTLPNVGTITFPNQGIAPVPPTFPANQDTLYAYTPPSTNVSELYVYKNIAGGSTAAIPFTASTLSTTATPAQFSSGWTYLPSGIIIKWGQGGSGNTITFDATVPFTQVFSVQLTLLNVLPVVPVAVSSVSNESFIWAGAPSGGNILYIAIGY